MGNAMRFLNLFRRRDLWKIAIYKIEDISQILRLDSIRPLRVFGEEGIRFNLDYQSTNADPFLFLHNDFLYLFYEVKLDHDHGEIWASRLSHDGTWFSLGCVLREQFHLAYPQVFESDGEIYMIPDAADSGKVLLYHALDFPTKWSVTSVIINEGLSDPTIYKSSDGNFYLFGTTRLSELKLYYSESIKNIFIDTGIVITRDRLSCRGAGNIVTIDGVRYRPAQDCRKVYGKKIYMYRIDELSQNKYSETIVESELLQNVPFWATKGYHHISVVSYGGCYYVALDGRSKDRYVNTITYGALRLREIIKSLSS